MLLVGVAVGEDSGAEAGGAHPPVRRDGVVVARPAGLVAVQVAGEEGVGLVVVGVQPAEELPRPHPALLVEGELAALVALVVDVAQGGPALHGAVGGEAVLGDPGGDSAAAAVRWSTSVSSRSKITARSTR